MLQCHTFSMNKLFELLSPAGARAVTTMFFSTITLIAYCCPPQGRELLPVQGPERYRERRMLLSPAGARAVTAKKFYEFVESQVAVPRRGVSCYGRRSGGRLDHDVAVPRRGASCYYRGLLIHPGERVAVPRRGASCYSKNTKNTMRIFGIPTIFLYYLLYFCVSIRDIVGFPRCEPACNNLIYCYYNTRFAPNQPVSKPSSIATGCKTQRHKL